MSEKARNQQVRKEAMHPESPSYGEEGVVPGGGDREHDAPHAYDNLSEGLVIPPQPEPGVRDEPAGAGSRAGEASPMTLVRRLFGETTVLLRKEIALAASEISHAVQDVRQGAVSVAGGGAVLYAGILFLLGAATLGLAEVVAPWLAALIVGGVVTLIGAVMLASGRKKLQPGHFAPRRAVESVRKDREMVRRQTS